MHRLKTTLSALLALPLLAFAPVEAEWKFISDQDDFTDHATQYVEFDDPKHNIQLKYQEQAIWMFITRKDHGAFKPSGKIELRVDKQAIKTIEPKSSPTVPITDYRWQPFTVSFLLWDGETATDCQFVDGLLNGSMLRIRYSLENFERHTLKASLFGSKEAMSKSLGQLPCQ